MNKIYLSGNYVIVEKDGNVYEYPRTLSVYTLEGSNYVIKERIDDGQFVIPISQIGTYFDEAGAVAYDEASLVAFLRTNTGFKTAGGGSPAYLLDLYNSEAAYSLRKLKTGVTNVISVRRSSDNAESDFTADEIIDGTLTNWVGANNGFITRIYDQVGTNNATQSISIRQPIIVKSGVLQLTNGLPTADFSDAAIGDVAPMVMGSAVTFQTAFTLAQIEILNTANYIIGNESPVQGLFYSGSSASITGIGGFDGTFRQLSGEDFNQNIAYFNMRGGNLYIAKNGAAETNTGAFSSSLTVNLLGGRTTVTQVFMRGNFQEIILFNSDESANKAAIEKDINNYYSVY